MFSTDPNLAIQELTTLDQGVVFWHAYAQCILNFVAEHYPQTSKQLPKVVGGLSFDCQFTKILGDVRSENWI
ncbi:hypothetical protein F0Z19_4477 [Vibrio cyclitrophicus]|nr:hypothetical protein F0Z19_4477 [Vibrio cyclitrophicus]PMG52892.1 hypothetical protein BCU88_21835 [Vibrio splendidus]